MTDDEILFLQEGFVTFFGSIIDKVSRYIFLMAITYLVAPADYGQFVFALSIVTLFYGLTDPSLHFSLTYYIPKLLESNERLKAIGTLQKIVGVAIAVSCVLMFLFAILTETISHLIDRPDLSEILFVLSPFILLYSFRDILKKFFAAVEKVRYSILLNSILFPVLRIVFTIPLVTVISIFAGLVTGLVISLIITIIFGVYIAFRKIEFDILETTETSSVSTKSIFRYSLPLFGATSAGMVVTKVDILLIGFLMSDAAVAVFKIGIAIATLCKIVTRMFKSISKPIFSRLNAGDSDQRLVDFYITSARWNALIITPVAAFIAALPNSLMNLLFSSRYAEGAVIVPILVAAYSLNIFTGNTGQILQAKGKTSIVFFQNSGTLIINALLSILLIPSLGLIGAAVGTAAGVVTSPIIALYYISKDFGRIPITKLHFIYVSMGGTCYLIVKEISFRMGGPLEILIGFVAVVALYPTGVVLLGGYNNTDLQILNEVIRELEERSGHQLSTAFKLINLLDYRLNR